MPRGTRYNRIPLNVAGGSNETRSRALSISRLVNWYPESTPAGVTAAALMPWPGLTVVSTDQEADLHIGRGSYVFNGKAYYIKGHSLYRLDGDMTSIKIGTIPGISLCDFSDNGYVMLIVTGGTVYQYDETSLTELSDIEFSPTAIDFLNGKFIFNSDTDRFWHTNPGTVIVDGANYAIPESSPDPFVMPYVFNEILYLFGTASIEPWEDIGSGNPSFERMNGAIIEKIGCASIGGITNSPTHMYFIDRSGIAYRVRSFQAEPITSNGAQLKFQGYDVSRYTAQSLSFDNQNFIVFNFYADGKTWVYAETTNTWFELTSGREELSWNGGSYVFCYGLHLFLDKTLPWIYKLDFANFLNNGLPIVRRKTFDFLSAERIGGNRTYYEMSKIVFGLETGVGLLFGQGEDPVIGVQFTTDGKTWSQEQFIRIGRNGEFSIDVECCNLQQFKQIAPRVSLYDPVGFAFFSAGVDVREAGY